ncbi:hypothetical protein BGZ63DRAFT_394857 [Mariannaea sp. PMI_226]|nr:hypothetical protein BGZ63DRAFT_394857 [Mariannaea sp. PMI_226]
MKLAAYSTVALASISTVTASCFYSGNHAYCACGKNVITNHDNNWSWSGTGQGAWASNFADNCQANVGTKLDSEAHIGGDKGFGWQCIFIVCG